MRDLEFALMFQGEGLNLTDSDSSWGDLPTTVETERH